MIQHLEILIDCLTFNKLSFKNVDNDPTRDSFENISCH